METNNKKYTNSIIRMEGKMDHKKKAGKGTSYKVVYKNTRQYVLIAIIKKNEHHKSSLKKGKRLYKANRHSIQKVAKSTINKTNQKVGKRIQIQSEKNKTKTLKERR